MRERLGWLCAYAVVAAIGFPIWWFFVRLIWTSSVWVVTAPCAEVLQAGFCR